MQKYALYSRTPDGKPQRNQKGVNRMNITKITVKKIEGQQTLRGVASVVLDDEIKIMGGQQVMVGLRQVRLQP